MKILGNRLYTGYFLVTLIFVFLLLISGYFQIGFLSDDYIVFYSSNISSLLEKFTSKVIYHNNLLFRPFWFLSLSFDIFLGKLFNLSTDSFFVSRIHNLVLYLLLAFIVSYILYYKSRNYILTILLYLTILLFPNNLHSLLWITCRNDAQFGVLGFLGVLLFLMYKKNEMFVYLVLSVSSFCAALFFKETAIIFPFIVLLIFSYLGQKKPLIKLKDYSYHFSVLLFYIVFKMFYLNVSTSDVLGYYSFDIFDRISVLPKALVSVLSSEDYLSLYYNFQHLDLIYIFSFSIPLLLILIVVFLNYKEKPKKLPKLLFIFILSITPNIIAGYFRPQLIIVPFSIIVLFLLLDVSLLKSNIQLFVSYILTVLVLIFAIESYARINDYKSSYNKIEKTMNLISTKYDEFKEETVFLFLPSRLKQTYILDYMPATYNFCKYKGFVLYDSIQGFVNYAALDIESLNSEINIQKINDTTVTALCTGKTQYFFNNENNSITDYENEYIKCEFQKEYMFLNKCKKVKLILKDLSKFDYIALTNNKLINLNPR